MDKYRVFVIDDDVDILSLLKNLLEADFEVICSSHPIEGLENLDDFEPDFVIVDIMMPLLDGREFVRRMRRKPQFVQTPIIFLSVLSDHNVIIASYKAGGDLFITKPFEPHRLLNSIRAFLKRRIMPVKRKHYSLQRLEEIQQRPPTTRTEPTRKSEPTPPPSEIKTTAPVPVPSQPPVNHEPPPATISIVSEVETPPSVTEIAQVQPLPPPAAPETEPPAPQRKPGKLPRILIADDEPELLDILTVSLGDKYELFTARNGIDVVREADKLEPDIFILDAMIPRLSGYQVCQILKRSEHFSHSPIIIISAKASRKDVAYVKKLGVAAFIAKPFTFMQLDNAIVKILNDPYFEIRPKLHTYGEILKKREDEAVAREKKEKERTHRETRSVLRDFIRRHPDIKR